MRFCPIKNIAFALLFCILLTLCNCSSGNELLLDNDIEYQEPDSIFNPSSDYIVVIGDIQEYTVSDEMNYYLKETCNWIRSQQKYFNCFACVLQNGDLTWANSIPQWNYADIGFSYLGTEVLLIPSIGNHDYTWGKNYEITDRNSTKINSLKTLSTLRRRPMEQFEPNRLDNIIVPIKVGRDTINIIALEFGPRKEVIAWADSIVQANPNGKYFLMTHEFLSGAGQRIDEGSYAALHFPNISHSTPQEIWDNLVYPNDNILCVLCGHSGFCKYLYSPNKTGRKVCQILFNLQYQDNGGDGMIQLWEFPNDENTINISVYNTIKRVFYPDSVTRISISL